MYPDLALYVGGEWKNGGSRKGEDVLNPATEKPLARLPHASKADLDEALEAAKKGFTLWRATSAHDRAKIMRKAADLMRERHDAISKVLVQEQGKVYVEGRSPQAVRLFLRHRRRRRGPASKRCAALLTRDCPRGCLTWYSACPQRSPSICWQRTQCEKYHLRVRSQSASTWPRSPPRG